MTRGHMTRGQRARLLAEQARVLPQLDALLRRAAGWIDPPGGPPADAPDAPAPARQARRTTARGVPADGGAAVSHRPAMAPAERPGTAQMNAPTSGATRPATASPETAALPPAAAASPVLRLRLPVRRASPVPGRVAKGIAPIAPIAASTPQGAPLPPRSVAAMPTHAAVADVPPGSASAPGMPTRLPVTRRAAPPVQADSAGGAWSALERFAAWPTRGLPAPAEAPGASLPRAENTDPLADAALEDRIEAILQRALAETGLDPA
jgi:hypothetical protein